MELVERELPEEQVARCMQVALSATRQVLLKVGRIPKRHSFSRVVMALTAPLVSLLLQTVAQPEVFQVQVARPVLFMQVVS
jgi:hypothetical protein